MNPRGLIVAWLLMLWSMGTAWGDIPVPATRPPVKPAGALPLTAELSSLSPPVAWGRPMPTVWDVRKLAPGIREGRFEFRVGYQQLEFYRYTSDEIVIGQDQQVYRWLFPAVTHPEVLPEIEVQVKWIGKKEEIDLGLQLIRVPTTARRTALMGVVESRNVERRVRSWDQHVQALTLETLGSESSRGFSPLQTVHVSWDASTFPQDPFVFTGYDLIAISSEQFSKLRRPQLDAVTRWVAAGGRLYLEPQGVLEPVHVEFLNRLVGGGENAPGFSLDRLGKLEWPPTQTEPEWSIVSGLGRGLLYDPPIVDDAVASRDARLRLWHLPEKLPARQLAFLLTESRIAMTNAWVPGMRVNPRSLNNRFHADRETRMRIVSAITDELMPSSVRIVPLWMIISGLVALVLVTGPGEWWYLGRLKLRRFTWFTWPATVMGLTLGFVTLSNAYLKSTDQPRTLTIMDLDRDGRPLRTNSFRLEFPRRTRDVTADLKQAVWSPLLTEDPGPTPFAPPVELPQAALPEYTGRIGQQATVKQTVKQWTPHLAREFSFSQLDDPAPIDWSRVPLEKYAGVALHEFRIPRVIVTALQEQLGPETLVAAFHGSGRWSCDGNEIWTNEVTKPVFQNIQRRVVPVEQWGERPSALSELLWRLTVPRPGQRFASTWNEPLLDLGLRDVPVLQTTQPNEIALVVVVPGPQVTRIYRYRIDGPPPPEPPTSRAATTSGPPTIPWPNPPQPRPNLPTVIKR